MKTKEFWSRLSTLDLQSDKSIADLMNHDQYHGPDAFEYTIMELALKKMENQHRKGNGAQIYKEAKILSPGRKSDSMIDSLSNFIPHRESIASQVETNSQKKHKMRQGRFLRSLPQENVQEKFGPDECNNI